VPNEGFLFVLWDFGMASLVPALKGCKEQLKSCQDFLKILNTPRWIIKHYPNIDVPSSVSDLCVHIRSMEHKSMKDLLEKVIQKFTQTRLTYVLETFDICRSNSTSSSSSSSSSSSVIKKIHPKTIPTTIVAAASKETEVPSRVITMSRAAVVTPGFRISDRKNKR
jgi:hypothetical protein